MRQFILALIALGMLALATDALFVEPYRIEVTHTTLTARVAKPLRIAHLSDVHTRAFGLRERKVLALLDAERPDVIMITGDTVGHEVDYKDIVPFLQRLHAPLGVWLVRGNWELYMLPPREHAFYSSLDVHFLLNEAQPVRPDVWVLGLDDPANGSPEPDAALALIPNDVYTIALFHAPRYFDQIAGQVPLALAGHTHGGRVRLPFVPVFWLPRGSAGFLQGLYAERGSWMYVSRGVGTSTIHVRFLCRPELAILTLLPR